MLQNQSSFLDQHEHVCLVVCFKMLCDKYGYFCRQLVLLYGSNSRDNSFILKFQTNLLYNLMLHIQSIHSHVIYV
jgi:hypothetical protein